MGSPYREHQEVETEDRLPLMLDVLWRRALCAGDGHVSTAAVYKYAHDLALEGADVPSALQELAKRVADATLWEHDEGYVGLPQIGWMKDVDAQYVADDLVRIAAAIQAGLHVVQSEGEEEREAIANYLQRLEKRSWKLEQLSASDAVRRGRHWHSHDGDGSLSTAAEEATLVVQYLRALSLKAVQRAQRVATYGVAVDYHNAAILRGEAREYATAANKIEAGEHHRRTPWV